MEIDRRDRDDWFREQNCDPFEQPHPSDRDARRERLIDAGLLAAIVALTLWGLSGYAGLWQPTPHAFGQVERPVAP